MWRTQAEVPQDSVCMFSDYKGMGKKKLHKYFERFMGSGLWGGQTAQGPNILGKKLAKKWLIFKQLSNKVWVGENILCNNLFTSVCIDVFSIIS